MFAAMAGESLEQAKADASSMHPLLLKRLNTPRTIFAPGVRIRMNVVPMFLNIFIPWGFFIWTASCSGFQLMYKSSNFAWFLLGVTYLLILILWYLAYYARKNTPEPSWWTYAAFAGAAAVIAGTWFGYTNFQEYMVKYYQYEDLKVISQIDAGEELGQNVMDAGVFYFAEGNAIDTQRSWHFKHSTVYCVAPIVKTGSPPKTNTYDFWAVGKDCCSMSSADFRCGAFDNPKARSAIRELSTSDVSFYRLAVEQSETLYGITSTNPVFFKWAQDPLQVVNDYQAAGQLRYLHAVGIAFVASLLAVSCTSFRFAFIGRSENRDISEFEEDDPMRHGARYS
eukprot:gnl/TRDRNA2_/TRDRNA2_182133_c0_seq1.p1 gnl/TRDRNA2_/TRDRNA2_182133_c0~~gnl/TRDRNA2_/TRDRNA2_182133_c0_seq1.p1  ORF type:complete len:371 (+),score=63.25 gnl/TRDRNA2_/TRDRNA2_182133_c0_seq1:98-1114(+)